MRSFRFFYSDFIAFCYYLKKLCAKRTLRHETQNQRVRVFFSRRAEGATREKKLVPFGFAFRADSELTMKLKFVLKNIENANKRPHLCVKIKDFLFICKRQIFYFISFIDFFLFHEFHIFYFLGFMHLRLPKVFHKFPLSGFFLYIIYVE